MGGLTAKVQLVSNALLLLGALPIASLDEESTGALLGANLFNNTYLTLLQDHRWRFATKKQQLSRLSATPNTGYVYAFQLPADFLYGFKGSASEFEVFGKEVHCNEETFYMEYIATIEEDQLPAYFAKALEYNLATQFSIPITGDEKKSVYYQKMFLDAVRKAKAIDATQYPEVAVQHTPYVTARY